MKIFDSVPMAKPQTSKFDLSHERKFSLNMGELIPIMVQEVLPGDRFRVNSEIMMRMAPMIAPVMHRINVYTHYFFVPNRLVWDEWEKFITGGEDGTAAPLPPFFNINTALKNTGLLANGQLCDYMGLPTFPDTHPGITHSLGVSALPFRAYQLIYDEYYRDQNLSAAIDCVKTSGEVTFDDGLGQMLAKRHRCWEKDYFTSALPWAQRGAEVLIPIEGEGDVTYKNITKVYEADGGFPASGSALETDGAFGDLSLGIDTPGRVENIDDVEFTNTSVTINDLRRSIALQKWLETNARGGARYTEAIKSHFGVTSPDARLQRPEYLGGGKQPVVISEVLSTASDPSGEGNPQGNMAGHGISVGNSNGFSQRFTEHGFVIGIMSVLPRTAYMDGVDRKWTRFDKFDYAWPKLANIGEQEVRNKEVFYDGVTGTHNETFGYQSRYSEYKYCPSTVHGDFRDSLDYWHMARKFDSAPALNQGFVEAQPTKRIFAVSDVDEYGTLYCQLYNSVSAIRPLPYYGVPAL